MKQELQRIKIAEACGWEKANHLGLGWWRHPVEKTACTTDDLPHYLYDLNAMHEAEKMLTTVREVNYRGERRIGFTCQVYWWCLCDVVGADQYEPAVEPLRVVSATAAQRAEAFLRTLGLWEGGGDE